MLQFPLFTLSLQSYWCDFEYFSRAFSLLFSDSYCLASSLTAMLLSILISTLSSLSPSMIVSDFKCKPNLTPSELPIALRIKSKLIDHVLNPSWDSPPNLAQPCGTICISLNRPCEYIINMSLPLPQPPSPFSNWSLYSLKFRRGLSSNLQGPTPWCPMHSLVTAGDKLYRHSLGWADPDILLPTLTWPWAPWGYQLFILVCPLSAESCTQ